MATHLVNTHEAKSRLSELIRRAELGDEIIVARNGRPVARIVAWPDARPRRVPGAWRGQVTFREDIVVSDPDALAAFDESLREPMP